MRRILHTLRDLDIMTRTIWGEARGQTDEDDPGVAWVIRNRSEIRTLSVLSVCEQPFQFSCWNWDDPNRRKMIALDPFSAEYMNFEELAKRVLEGEMEDPTFGADHYHASYVSPWWTEGMEFVVELGPHKFYRSTQAVGHWLRNPR